jgi:hypothetical protein
MTRNDGIPGNNWGMKKADVEVINKGITTTVKPMGKNRMGRRTQYVLQIVEQL